MNWIWSHFIKGENYCVWGLQKKVWLAPWTISTSYRGSSWAKFGLNLSVLDSQSEEVENHRYSASSSIEVLMPNTSFDLLLLQFFSFGFNLHLLGSRAFHSWGLIVATHIANQQTVTLKRGPWFDKFLGTVFKSIFQL